MDICVPGSSHDIAQNMMQVAEARCHHGRAANLVRDWQVVHGPGRLLKLHLATHDAFPPTRIRITLSQIEAAIRAVVVIAIVGHEMITTGISI